MILALSRRCLWAAALVVALGCGADDPVTADAGVDDEPIVGAACSPAPTYTEDVSGCQPAATDYRPRDNGSANDDWSACISDDDTWHRIEESVSTIARVEAYEAIGQLLWSAGAAPTHDDFVAARVLFEEEQGLGSRVARRYDVHYPAPASGGCEDEGVAAANRDYCVGPATLQPLIVEAFAEGASGRARVVNAARIRAAVQWFLYVSTVKEATTCTDTPKDCDSAWAYYSGGTARESPIGLAGDIDEHAPETHDRGFDGVLAVRCWRDLDQAVPAADLTLRDRAIDQTDAALVRGMALIVRQRFAELGCATGDYRAAAMAALEVLVPLLDRETRARDSAVAERLLAAVRGEAEDVDVAAALADLDATYPCP